MGDHKDKRVVVGAGILGVVAALEFCEAEYKVEVFERSPDPRSKKPWMAFGCTLGGDNARMFSLTERAIVMTGRSERSILNRHIERSVDNFGWLIGSND